MTEEDINTKYCNPVELAEECAVGLRKWRDELPKWIIGVKRKGNID